LFSAVPILCYPICNGEKFHDLFSTAEELGKEIGEDIKIPRVTQLQKHRANYESTSAENYYRVSRN